MQFLQHRSKIYRLSVCAVFAALTALLSQIGFRIGPIPFNLATLAVFLSGGLLGAKYGAAAQASYVLLGAMGAPVFSQLTGGLSIAAGPTGGYLAGYAACALITGCFSQRGERSSGGTATLLLVSGMLVGCISYFALGTAWYMMLTGNGLAFSLSTCVLPFLPGDAVKIAAATVLVRRLSPLLLHMSPQRVPPQP